MLSGLGVPDMRGRVGTPAYYTSDPNWQIGDNEFSLDDGPGALYLASLVADPAFNAPLRQLVQDTVRADREPRTFDDVVRSGALRSDAAARTAQQILVLWYSGLVNDRTADYLEALAWESLPFPKPPSTELGFSKWDEAP